MTRRTTAALVETAISAAIASGRPFTAVEVQSGGVVHLRCLRLLSDFKRLRGKPRQNRALPVNGLHAVCTQEGGTK